MEVRESKNALGYNPEEEMKKLDTAIIKGNGALTNELLTERLQYRKRLQEKGKKDIEETLETRI